MSYFFIGIFFLSLSLSYFTGTVVSFYLGQNPIEPFLLIGLFCLIKSSKNFKLVLISTITSDLFKILFSYTLIMFLTGIFLTGDVPRVYADFRSNLILFFLILFFTSNKWEKKERVRFIISLSWGLTLFDLTTMIISPYFSLKNNDSVSKHNISTILPCFLMIYYFFIGKMRYLTLLFFIIIYEVAFAFMRNVYLIVAISFVLMILTVLYSLFRKGTKRFSVFSFLFFFILAGYFIFNIIYDFWLSDGSRSVHSIRRTSDFLNNASGESERINSLLLPFTDFDKLLLPNGLGARQSIENVSKLFENKILSSNDSSFFYLAYHYGVFFCFLFTYFFILRTLFIIFSFFLRKRFYIGFVSFGLFIGLSTVYFAQSIMLTFVPAATAYAIVYSIIVKPQCFFSNG